MDEVVVVSGLSEGDEAIALAELLAVLASGVGSGDVVATGVLDEVLELGVELGLDEGRVGSTITLGKLLLGELTTEGLVLVEVVIAATELEVDDVVGIGTGDPVSVYVMVVRSILRIAV
nr:hypothetical protein B0A51_00593 [Rachicladosporium sp. CCFEE 5018]